MSGKSAALTEDRGPGHIVGDTEPPEESAKRKSRLRPVIIAGIGLLVVVGALAGLGLTGIVKLPFLSHRAAQNQPPAEQVQFIKLPELVANLDAGPASDSYAKLQTVLEVTDSASAAAVIARMTAVIDLFQPYLRAMQPDDLRGSDGLYRLREAMLARVNILVARASWQNVLFIEMVVQ